MNKPQLLLSRKFIALLFLVSMFGGCASTRPTASAQGGSESATAPITSNSSAFLAMVRAAGQYSRSSAFGDFEKGTKSIVDFRASQSVMNWLSQDENFMKFDLDSNYNCFLCKSDSKRQVKTIQTKNKNCSIDVGAIAPLVRS